MDSLTVALLAGIGGMLGWGLADFFAKKTIDKIGAIKSLVWAHTFGTTSFILVALAQVSIRGQSLSLPGSGTEWVGLVFFGVLQMIVYWLVYEGFEKGQLAVLNPVFASYSGLVALIAIMFFGEPLSILLGIGLVAIFAGILVINLDFSDLRSKKVNIVPGLLEVGAGAILAAGWTIGWDRFVSGQSALTYALFMYIFMTVAAFALAILMKVPLFGLDRRLFKYVALIGVSEMVAYLAISWGYSETSRTGVIALVSGAFSLPTIVLAFLFLKERITRVQSFAIAVTVVGIMLVSIA